jgi:hypothetical protein
MIKAPKALLASLCCISALMASGGCCGLGHSSAPCCNHVQGKYYRATLVDMIMMKSKPLLSPLVILTDLPFALVIETIEVPFIAIGVMDPTPRPMDLDDILPPPHQEGKDKPKTHTKAPDATRE